MLKKFFIYEVLGFPNGPFALRTVAVPNIKHAYYVDSTNSYDSIEEAEQHLKAQEEFEFLQGDFVILPVYHLEMD